MPETIVQFLCSACGKPAVIYYTESRMAYCDRHRPSGLCLDTSHQEERERLVRQREIAEAERDKARAEADALKATGADFASSLFAQHQKAALDLYDAIYRQAEPIVGAVDGGPLAQVEALVNEIRGLRRRLSATVAERDTMRMEWGFLSGVVPQTFGEAVMRYGAGVVDCEPHEWDNRTTVYNAIWLLERLAALNHVLSSRLGTRADAVAREHFGEGHR
jgi:hypothetical protein